MLSGPYVHTHTHTHTHVRSQQTDKTLPIHCPCRSGFNVGAFLTSHPRISLVSFTGRYLYFAHYYTALILVDICTALPATHH